MRRGAAIGAGIALAAVAVTAVVWWANARPAAQPTPSPTTTSVTQAPPTSGTPTPSPSVAPDLAWGPTERDWQDALATARALTVKQAAGQVIMASVSTPDAAAAAQLVKSRHLAGLLVMGDAIADRDRVTALTAAIAGADPDRDSPIIVATDEEGGTVQRLRPVLGYVSAFMGAGANGDPEQIGAHYSGLGAQMLQLGFTMTMAPVADVTIGVADPTIRTRSAGSEPDAVAGVVSAAWQGFSAAGVTPVIKHFPGHGSVTKDSHVGLPHQTKTIAELGDEDLLPFSAAIDEGVPAVMVGHLAVAGWGSTPTSVNPRTYAYLRHTLGFTGLAITDAMNMEAITDRYGSGAAAAAAIRAGADLVLMPASTDGAIKGIVVAVTHGTLSRDRLNEAAARVILAARWQQGLDVTAATPQRPGEFAEGSIVVASANCSALIGDEVKITGGTAAQRKALAAALRELGVKVSNKGTHIRLVDGDRGRGTGDVVVAMGGPWGLHASKATTFVATWGSGAEQLRALAVVLTGGVEPRGTWPVKVNLPVPTCG